MNLPRHTIFSAAIAWLPHVSKRPLEAIPESDRGVVAETAFAFAKLLADKCRSDFWGATIDPIPSLEGEMITPADGRPEWIRLPKANGRCEYTGLSRSKLYTMVGACRANGFRPPVRSVVLRQRGQIRGVRLISYDSLMTYLKSLPSDGVQTRRKSRQKAEM